MSFGQRMVVGLALGLTLGGAAQAEPASVACQAGPYGAFQLPGTDTCLRIGGSVAAEFGAHVGGANSFTLASPQPSTARSAGALTSSRIETRLSVDIRSQTEFGPVRAYVSLRRSRPPLP